MEKGGGLHKIDFATGRNQFRDEKGQVVGKIDPVHEIRTDGRQVSGRLRNGLHVVFPGILKARRETVFSRILHHGLGRSREIRLTQASRLPKKAGRHDVPDPLLVVNRLHRKQIGHRPFFSLGRLLLVEFKHVVIKYWKNFNPAHKNVLNSVFFQKAASESKNY